MKVCGSLCCGKYDQPQGKLVELPPELFAMLVAWVAAIHDCGDPSRQSAGSSRSAAAPALVR